MNNYPTHERPELVSHNALDDLFTDAQNWRDLVAEITGRGHGHGDDSMTTVEAIAGIFPDFRKLANAIHAEDDQNDALNLQGPPDPFLDAFLTPHGAQPTMTPRDPNLSLPEMEVQTIAHLNSISGPVIAGYTNDAQLAFAFEDLHEVHTVPLNVLLADLVRHLTTKQAFLSKRTKPQRTSAQTKPTRLM